MRAARIAASVAVLLAVLAAGLWLGGHPEKLPRPVSDAFVGGNAGLNVEATEAIEENYFREVSPDELTNSSLQGMVRGLRQRYDDRFTDYFSPESLEKFREEIAGKFSGVGVSVIPVKKGLEVGHVFKRSPADRSGVEVGEVFVSVEGDSIAGVDSEVAAGRIKGPEGTDVKIGVLDPKTGETRQLTITRAEISLPVAFGRAREFGGRKLGYVRLSTFSYGSHAYLRKAIERAEREGAEGIVLDLRANGGGLLDEAVLAASVFLPEDEVVVTTDSRTQGHAEYRTYDEADNRQLHRGKDALGNDPPDVEGHRRSRTARRNSRVRASFGSAKTCEGSPCSMMRPAHITTRWSLTSRANCIS